VIIDTRDNLHNKAWARNKFHTPERVVLQERVHGMLKRQEYLSFPPPPDPRAGAALSVGERCGQRKRPRNRLCAKTAYILQLTAAECWDLASDTNISF